MKNQSKYLRNGCGLIAEERDRQTEKLNYTTEHDDAHINGDLTLAARCFAGHAAGMMRGCEVNPTMPAQWPWEGTSWKPSADPVRDLVKAGALIAAEIDRHHRAFQEACNAYSNSALGFDVFDEMDAYDLARVDWVGCEPRAFVREHFAEDFEQHEYDDDLRRQSEEAEEADRELGPEEESDDGQ